ncbi:GMC family oxidoreductase [Ramlibacter tataouinensis]|uniref:Choline dehydrogenase and related flavoprotein-like protein n=1 Tax=Ramlibacter tataouinensis (strain ATCC BAA-407 / DSM 14655 / LMG 21543 / TTB310) TaxID=365046 RepID=F5Y128_RAMTT|nr:GMC family oxidoreductase [Ramlibacter tataouinensis]AEG92246.1 choline dehydrogenase and related flavoprotein-like protein [Ramlibacter tataouinensis TTB310]
MAATRLPPVDAVVLGVGLVGSMLGRELTKAGLKVVGLERGQPRATVPDFQGPQMHDELRYSVRKAMMQDTARETLTFRNKAGETALPMRRWESFLPGTGVGGSAVHWNGQTFRFQDSDFRMRTRTLERYGEKMIAPGLLVQDWGVNAAELEPYYDRFEYLLGTSGKAGHLQGKKIEGGNPFEDSRSREYPTPPQKEPYGSALFRKAAQGLGYHPFPQPSSNLSQPYTNTEGVQLRTCMFCGFCERYGCEHYAKSSPQTTLLPVLLRDRNFTLRTQCQVLRINLDKDKKRATSVTYIDAAGREFEQPASLVIVGMYALNNVRMLLLSGIGQPYDPATGKGVVGRNYAYQTTSGVQVFFDEKVNINPFMRSGACGTVIGDFASDNFDHGPLGFLGGAFIGEIMTNGRPIEFHPTPPGTPAWGSAWKRAVARHYNHTSVLQVHGSSIAATQNYLDLDPTYKDAWGLPLLRMTFDFPENDLRLSNHITARAVDIARAMGGRQVNGTPRRGPYTATQYQSTHNTGGTVMGTDPSTSTVNRWLQSWDVPNVFVIGASNFPQNASYNPTDTVGALAYWAADAIVGRYLKQPGPLA